MTDHAKIVREWLTEGKRASVWSRAPETVIAALAALEQELAEAYGANYMAKYLSQIERAEAAEAERDRLREALREIASEWEGQMGTGQMLSDFARAALAGVCAGPS